MLWTITWSIFLIIGIGLKSGHIRIKEISIPGYDIQVLLKHENLVGLDLQKIQAIANGLKLERR
ncbi:hypothetical protein [Sphingobacterium faecium]|uniref:hypothetical protein n=1 Tax=Sphingobacterium faecium TaxID=34087 RepID=UPI00320AFC24